MSRNTSYGLLLLTFIGFGCEGDDRQITPDSETSCLGVTSSLAIKDRMGQTVNVFIVGEEIYGEISVTNNNPTPRTLHSGGACKDARFEVRDSNGQTQFHSDNTLMCVARAQPLTYAPYETKTHRQSLHTSVQQGPLPSGHFTVIALGGQFSDLPPQGDLEKCQEIALSRTASFVIQ